MKRIHITTGDADGIGLEVTYKALSELLPLPGVQCVVWRSHKTSHDNQQMADTFIRPIQKSCRVIRLNEPQKLNTVKREDNTMLDMACSLFPTEWVVRAAQHCLSDPVCQALVTGPLSKGQMQSDGFLEIGHTPLLKKLSQAKEVFMAFLGDSFHVVLLSGHTPLKNIVWSKETLNRCLKCCLSLREHLPGHDTDKPLAVLGLNPHAGEGGLLGTEDITLKQQLQKWQSHVAGPLVPDTAFAKKNWNRFSMYICLYHDQGLIPFKMIHEGQGLQLSLGLPFIRTSVSHGTAKDIFGKNKASAESMKKALLFASKWEHPVPCPKK